MCLPSQPVSVLLNDAVFLCLVPPALTQGRKWHGESSHHGAHPEGSFQQQTSRSAAFPSLPSLLSLFSSVTRMKSAGWDAAISTHSR